MRLVPVTALLLAAAACGGAARSGSPPAVEPPITTPTTAAPPRPPARVFSRAEATALFDSLVGDQQFRTANWGVLVVHPASGDTLYSHNAERLFVPASNTKLVTGAVALAALGPDYTWKTIVTARGVRRDSVLEGDLVVVGRGDPTVSNRISGSAMEPLRRMADSVAARGIRRVTGRVLRGGNAFPDARWGAGWQWDYLDAGYAAAIDDLFFNEGQVRVAVYAGAAPGDPPRVTTSPARSYPLVRMEALTQMAGNGNRSRATLTLDSLTGHVIVRGSLIAGDSLVQTLTLHDPAAAYLAAFREALAERGVVVEGVSDASNRVQEWELGDTLVVLRSAPFREVLGEMMKPSQNQLAEMFLKTVGLEATGTGSANTGLNVVRRHMLEWGVAEDGFALRDGSGLTRNNFISPESVVRLLHAMRQHEHFRIFFASLPTAAVDGTLRSRMANTPAADNVRGKTGTLARASALSGYVNTLDGEELIFSLFCNNFTAAANAVTGMQNTIAVTLASLELRR